jgi:hypothetical protein
MTCFVLCCVLCFVLQRVIVDTHTWACWTPWQPSSSSKPQGDDRSAKTVTCVFLAAAAMLHAG